MEIMQSSSSRILLLSLVARSEAFCGAMASPPPVSAALGLTATRSCTGDGRLKDDVENHREWLVEDENAHGDQANRTPDDHVSGSYSRRDQFLQPSAGEACLMNRVCRLCGEEGSEEVGELLPSPCRCADAYIHISCIEHRLLWVPEVAACPSCRVMYPVRRHTKSLWRWFVERETRADGLLFVGNILFSIGSVIVVAMAWMYALFQDHPNAWISKTSLLAILFVITILWAAFGCHRFHLLYEKLARWRQDNTTLTVPLGGNRPENV